MNQNHEVLTEKARAIGLGDHINHLPQKALIRKIQKAQGQEPCFLSDNRYYCDVSCEWSQSCKALTAAWLR